MNKKSIFWGLSFILLAAYVIVSKLGIMPAVPIVKVIFAILFAAWAVKGLVSLHFFEFFKPLAIIGCIFDKELGIQAITPWTLVFAALLLSVGFDLIFKNARKSRKHFHGKTYSENVVYDEEDGEIIHVGNVFSEQSKYVNSNNFRRADIDNSFGQTNVYFNNAIIPANTNAVIDVDNSFGQTNIYLPKTWRVEIKRDCAFGDIKVHGCGNNDMDANLVLINADCSFGEIEIFFE